MTAGVEFAEKLGLDGSALDEAERLTMEALDLLEVTPSAIAFCVAADVLCVAAVNLHLAYELATGVSLNVLHPLLLEYAQKMYEEAAHAPGPRRPRRGDKR